MEYVYLISENADTPPTKVGKSSNPRKRLKQHRRAHGKELQLQFVYKGGAEVEDQLLRLTEAASVGGTEWRVLSARKIARRISNELDLDPVPVDDLPDGTDPKDSGDEVKFNARIPENLRDAFQEVCESEGRSMSWTVREYMRRVVEEDAGT